MSSDSNVADKDKGDSTESKLNIERERLLIEEKKFDAELKKLEIETNKLKIENEKLSIEKKKLSYNERFRNISTGVQGLAVALAAVIGGWFGYIKYIEVESPEAQELKRKAHMDINLEFERSIGRSSERVIAGTVIAKNVGNGVAYIDLSKDPNSIYLSKVEFDPNGAPIINKDISTTSGLSVYWTWSNYIVGPNDSIKFPFVYKVKDPGIYLVTITLPMSERDIFGKRAEDVKYFWHTSALTKVE